MRQQVNLQVWHLMMTNGTMLEQDIMTRIRRSRHRIRPLDLERDMARTHHVRRKDVRTALHALVAQGKLTYVNELGCTFVEPSLESAVRLTDHLVIRPPGVSFVPGKDDIVLTIGRGAAFGDGRHPTTRLALRGIEYLLKPSAANILNPQTHLLDIGTGSGILALAALKMGIEKGIGLDRDACARHEARVNATLNQLEKRLKIQDGPLDGPEGPFDLITANLRPPTLHVLYDNILALTRSGGFVVFSGMKTQEADAIALRYGEPEFKRLWQASEIGWCAMAFRRIERQPAAVNRPGQVFVPPISPAR